MKYFTLLLIFILCISKVSSQYPPVSDVLHLNWAVQINDEIDFNRSYPVVYGEKAYSYKLDKAIDTSIGKLRSLNQVEQVEAGAGIVNYFVGRSQKIFTKYLNTTTDSEVFKTTINSLPRNYVHSLSIFKGKMGVVQKNDSTISIIDQHKGFSVISDFTISDQVVLSPVLYKGHVVVASKTSLYIYFIESQRIEKIPLDGFPIASTVYKDVIVIWQDKIGMLAIDINSLSVKWNIKSNASKGTINLLKNDGCIIYEDGKSIYRVDVSDGKKSLFNDDGCTSNSSEMRIIGQYLLRYNDCFEEGDHFPKLIELLSLESGEITHRGWTPSDYEDVDTNPRNNNGINEMDEGGIIRFSRNFDQKEFLLGQRKDRIFRFDLKSD